MIKIFLDDERLPPDDIPHVVWSQAAGLKETMQEVLDQGFNFWIVVRDFGELKDFLYSDLNPGPIRYISFDHDLGMDENGQLKMNGYEITKWLVDNDLYSEGRVLAKDFEFYVHSQNPVGAESIRSYLNGYLENRIRD